MSVAGAPSLTPTRLPTRVGAAAPADTPVLVLLTLATVLATVWAVVAGGWSEGMSLALLTTALAVVAAALVARSAASRLVAALAVPLLGLLVIVPLTFRGIPDDGSTAGLRHAGLRWAGALAGGLASGDGWAFQVGLCAATWVLGCFAGWMVVRERRGIPALLPCVGTLASNAVNAPNPSAVALPTVMALGCALVLLARTALADLERHWTRQRVVSLPGTRRRYTAVAVAAAGIVLAVGVLLPPLSSADISGRIFHFNLDDLGRGSGPGDRGGGRDGAAPPATISFSPSTQPGGALVDAPRSVLAFTTDTASTVYLRANTDVLFDRGSWYPATDSLEGVSFPGGQVPRDRSPGDGGVSPTSTSVRTTLGLAPGVALGDIALFPGDPDSVDRPAIASGVASAGALLTVEKVALRGGFSSGTLTTTGLVNQATEPQLRGAGTDYPEFIRAAGYLDVSDPAPFDHNLSDILALARSWTAGAATAYDKARAVEVALRQAPFSYTLTPPEPRPGEWPIHAFLVRTHVGYCQYFASAMGTMLRLLAIPARLVTGYGPGTVDDSASAPRRVLHRVTTSDAHVWVEAYFPGQGWVTFEPTPASQFGVYDPIPRPGSPAAPESTIAPATPAPGAATPTPTATPRSDQPGGPAAAGHTIPPGLLGGVAGGIVLVVLTLAGIGWLRQPRSLPALWQRIRLLGRALGIRSRPSETAAEFATRLSAALPPDGATLLHHRGGDPSAPRVRQHCADLITQIAALSGKAEFSAAGLDRHERLRWQRAWLRLTRAIPGLLWRRLLAGRRPAS